MIVISNPIAIANEINIIHTLFEEGLELFHIRKPDFSEIEMAQFLHQIKMEFRKKIVLHSHHQIAEDFGINRIHLTEKTRKKITNKQLEEYKNTGFLFSASTHSIEDFNDLENDFDYAFLSPVFLSISKENYKSKIDLLNAIKDRTNFNTKLVALGGIEAQNIKKTLDAGFDDVALLGTIWNSKQPIKNFELCQQIVLSY